MHYIEAERQTLIAQIKESDRAVIRYQSKFNDWAAADKEYAKSMELRRELNELEDFLQMVAR